MNHNDTISPAVRGNNAAAGEVSEEGPAVVPSSSNDTQCERPLSKRSVLRLRANDMLRQKAMEIGKSIATS